MKQRLFSLLASLMVFAAMLPTAPASAHNGTGVSHYYMGCNTSSDSAQSQAFVYRESGHGSYSQFSGVSGYVEYRALHPCLNGSNSYSGAYFYNPASIQGNGVIVQDGIWECAGGGTSDCNGMNPYQVYFWYSCHNDGQVCEASFFPESAPTVGHDYQFRVQWVSNDWQYCIMDVSTNATWYCTVVATNSSYGTEAWWAYEQQNLAGAMGPLSTDSNADIYDYQYRPNGGSWTTVNGTLDPSCSYAYTNPTGWVTCHVYQTSGYETERASTYQHM